MRAMVYPSLWQPAIQEGCHTGSLLQSQVTGGAKVTSHSGGTPVTCGAWSRREAFRVVAGRVNSGSKLPLTEEIICREIPEDKGVHEEEMPEGIIGEEESSPRDPFLPGVAEQGGQQTAVDPGSPRSHALHLLSLLQGRHQARELPLNTSIAFLNALRPLPPPTLPSPPSPQPPASYPLVHRWHAHCETPPAHPLSEADAPALRLEAGGQDPEALERDSQDSEAVEIDGEDRDPCAASQGGRDGGDTHAEGEAHEAPPDAVARSHWAQSGRLLGESLVRLQARGRLLHITSSTATTSGRGVRIRASPTGCGQRRGRRTHASIQRRGPRVWEGSRAQAAERLIRRPPQSVIRFCQHVAHAASLEGARLGELLAPWYTEGTHAVPDVEGSQGARCQLTADDGACRRFASQELEAYFAFLFCAVSRFSGNQVGGGTPPAADPSFPLGACAGNMGGRHNGGHTGGAPPPFFALSRFDLFHAHVFVDPWGRVGALFHAREYPARHGDSFPFGLGFCQEGSWVRADDLMPLRNVLWLGPSLHPGPGAPSWGPHCPQPCPPVPLYHNQLVASWPNDAHFSGEALHLPGLHAPMSAMRRNFWDPAEGVLVSLDVGAVPGLVEPGLEPLHTVLESNFGRTVCEINFFPRSTRGGVRRLGPLRQHPVYVVPFEN